MKYKWLNNSNNNELIIFFNGWGMDENIVKNLDPENIDVLMFYDYNDLETDFDFNFLNYEKKFLVAWSMGVMTATLFNIEYNSKTAINGTLKPIDNRYGIPEKIYSLTEKGFSHAGAERFIKNMYDNDCIIPSIKRNFENQKSELSALRKYSANEDFKYDRVIISANDKIFPAKNQSAFWNTEPNINAGHAPFEKFKYWRELL